MREIALDSGWQLARTAPGACTSPDALGGTLPAWREAVVPGTVAATLAPDPAIAGDYDAHDWWYRTTFTAPPRQGGRYRLRFEGLATLAQVWLNGQPVLASDNMFVGHTVDVTPLLRDLNQLVIRFASLDAALREKRPRPRWKTQLVEAQNLRWFRTTLLGRMPGWSPAVPAVGPWQPVVLECLEAIDVEHVSVQARAEKGVGHVTVRAAVSPLDAEPLQGARLVLDGHAHDLRILQGHDARIQGEIAIPGVPLWWPHTHGAPALVPWSIEILRGSRWTEIAAGRIGFREIDLDTRDGRVELRINGVPVFCRGACWTPTDVVRLRGDPVEIRRTLAAMRDAGANMVRIGGTMVYETEAFYAACDELGLMAWQDFMFANMDYPVRDPGFRRNIEGEARSVLARLQRHACVVAYCGGSEVAQQAAMMGLGAEHWSNEFFDEALPGLCATEHAGVPYFPSSPWGGALPFHVGTGIAHYYGVGAYRRPIDDVRGARVKFATECLGFSNVPEDSNLEKLRAGPVPPPHHPQWKARVPRDNGSGYDFEDVRDHYLRELAGEDPVALRAADPDRYRALSRVVSGEVMKRVYAQWRAPHDPCAGGLVWFARDLWPGAGWGVLDSDGQPKPAYWALKRAWAPQAVVLTDEGMDGVALHALNEGDTLLDATLEVELLKGGRVVTRASAPVLVPARGAVTRSVDAIAGFFTDHANAYRFGPPKGDVVAVRLRRNADGAILSADCHFPTGLALGPASAQPQVAATLDPRGDVRVEIDAPAFLQSVRLVAPGFLPDDNYFHVVPGTRKTVHLRRIDPTARFEGTLEALNLGSALPLPGPATPASAQGDLNRG